MPRGAKPGENRFKSAQRTLTNFRVGRLQEIVVPKLKALSAHTNISSINRFCGLAADIYNESLPVGEKPISYRRLNQSEEYWSIIGPVYYRYFQKKKNLEEFKRLAVNALDSRKASDLEAQISRLKSENNALRLTLNGQHNPITTDCSIVVENSKSEIENLGRIIELLIAKSGVIDVDIENTALRDLADDMESSEGMLPKDVVEPYINWIRNKKSKLGEGL